MSLFCSEALNVYDNLIIFAWVIIMPVINTILVNIFM